MIRDSQSDQGRVPPEQEEWGRVLVHIWSGSELERSENITGHKCLEVA